MLAASDMVQLCATDSDQPAAPCLSSYHTLHVCVVLAPRVAEIQKRERKRRGRAAQEARAVKKEARLEQDRTDRIAAMREFTVDLQVRKAAHRAGVARCFVAHLSFAHR